LAHLTTYSFQAPQFYQKNGFVVCGEIDGFPDLDYRFSQICHRN